MRRAACAITVACVAALAFDALADAELSTSEAHLLALIYVKRYLPGGTFAAPPRLYRDHWSCPLIGARGSEGYLSIDITTGDVSYHGALGSRPTVSAATLRQWVGFRYN
jgi:hypothetical protein